MKNFKILLIGTIMLFFASYVKAEDPVENEKIYHRVLLFTWQDSLSVDTKAKFLGLFEGLPEKVDGFISCTINDIEWSKDGYHTVLDLSLISNEAVKIYEEHPDHLNIMEMGPKVVKNFSLFNYWK